jgi:hypothetical protein
MDKDLYQKLLTSYDWKIFRYQILQRDNFKCISCNNNQLIRDNNLCLYALSLFHIPFIVDPEDADKTKPFFCTHAPKTNFLSHFLSDKLSVQEFIRIAVTEKKRLWIAVQNQPDGNSYEYGIAISKNVKSDSFSAIEKEQVLANINLFEWRFIFGLHVHHTYYQDGLLPWDYPSESLKTFCYKCHETLHKNEQIPRYDKSGRLIGNLTPCPRCIGAGWFPQYKHVENGICFYCQGARFVELINN